MNTTSSPATLRFTARTARVVRVTLISVLLSALALICDFMFALWNEDLELTLSTLLVPIITVSGLIVGRLHGNAVDLLLTPDMLHVGRGLGLLQKRGRRIPLQNIHTVVLVGAHGRTGFKPTTMYLAFKWPERKMLYAEASVSLAALPDLLAFLREFFDRVDDLRKISWNGKILTREELASLLGAPDSPLSASSAGRAELPSNSEVL